MGFGIMERSDSLSRLSKKFGQTPKEPRVIDLSIRREEKLDFVLSREYEVLSPLMVSSAEALSSPIIGELSAGSCVTILGIRSGGRLKVTDALGTVTGWVSSTSLGRTMLRKIDDSQDNQTGFRSNSLTSFFSDASHASRASRASRAVSSSLARLRGKKDHGLELTKHPNIGDVLEAEGKVIVRADESMSSLKILTLKGGCQLRVLDYGNLNRNRIKVSVEGTTGWVSVLDKNLHEPLFGQRPH